jgi:hypothetical protein
MKKIKPSERIKEIKKEIQKEYCQWPALRLTADEAKTEAIIQFLDEKLK